MRRQQGKGATDGYGGIGVDPHKERGGKRKGKSMKKKGYAKHNPVVTVQQVKAALAVDSNAVYSKTLKCLIYKREG